MIAGLIFLQAALSIAVAGPATNPEYLPLRVAAAEGYFTEEKLTVTLETLRAEPLAAQALGRGRVALAATSLDAALSLGHAGSAPPRLVFGLTAAPPVALLVPAAKRTRSRRSPISPARPSGSAHPARRRAGAVLAARP